MDKKIVFFDIDGTIYDSENGVSDSTKTAIQQLLHKGHIPIICTGRTRSMVPEYLMDIGFPGIVAGAGTYIEYAGELVHHKVEGMDYVSDILSLLHKNNIKYVIEGPEYVYYDSTDKSPEYDFINDLLLLIGSDKGKPISNEEMRMNKITCFIPDYNNLISLLPKIEEKFHVINHQDGNLVELVPNGYNKATGIQKMIEHLSIDRKNTYAFGDSTNDLEMLEYVEYGIAMGNSYPEVLKIAKYKTKSIKEDGVYYGLKEFGLI
jgi:Cof subfamily protein (haloacid dehalogenase superfamily)